MSSLSLSPGSVQRLQQHVQDKIARIQCSCLGQLEIKVCVLNVNDDLQNKEMVYTTQDICKIMEREHDLWEQKKGIRQKKEKYQYYRIYLDQDNEKDSLPLNQLKHAFLEEAVKTREGIVCNGGAKKTKNPFGNCVLHLRCPCSDYYRGPKVDANTGQLIVPFDGWKVSLLNDRKNNRPRKTGRSGSRKTSIMEAIGKGSPRCPFCICSFLGPKGYFIQAWLGNPYRLYHHQPHTGRVPTKILKADERKLIHDISGRGPSKARVAVHTHFTRSMEQGMTTLLTLQQVRYINQKLSGRRLGQPLVTQNDHVDSLYEFLEESNASYLSLIQKSQNVVSPSEHAIYNELCIPNKQSNTHLYSNPTNL